MHLFASKSNCNHKKQHLRRGPVEETSGSGISGWHGRNQWEWHQWVAWEKPVRVASVGGMGETSESGISGWHGRNQWEWHQWVTREKPMWVASVGGMGETSESGISGWHGRNQWEWHQWVAWEKPVKKYTINYVLDVVVQTYLEHALGGCDVTGSRGRSHLLLSCSKRLRWVATDDTARGEGTGLVHITLHVCGRNICLYVFVWDTAEQQAAV